MPPRIFGFRTGHVDELDYDIAVAFGLGAKLDLAKNQLWLPLSDSAGKSIFVKPPNTNAPAPITKALVVMKQSEPTHTEWELPSILIARDDVTPALQREWSPTEQYRLPAPGARQISVGDTIGYDCFETKEREWPFDFTYTIECWSRYRTVAQILKQMMMRAYPPYSSVTVTDGLENERVYHVFQEGTADLTEINSLVDRIVGFSVTIRIEGELTSDRVPKVTSGFVGTTRPPGGPGGIGDPTGPFDPNSPDPGDGGLYGDGQPLKRVTSMGSDE